MKIVLRICLGLVCGVAMAADPPAVPTGFLASEGTAANQVRLSWDPAPSSDTSFEVYRWDGEPSQGPRLWISAPAGTTRINDAGVATGKTYVYWLRAVNAAGRSDNSLPVRGYTLDQPSHLKRIYFNALNKDPGWPRDGQWTFGVPGGAGATSFGGPDPTIGATGTNVFGVNLRGDYAVSHSFNRLSLTAGPFDCTGQGDVRLRYRRWLNSDYEPYVSQTVSVSANGTDWTEVWFNGSDVEFLDARWHTVMLDLSSVADGQPAVYVRWNYFVTDLANPYSGWNIDDIELLGAKKRKN